MISRGMMERQLYADGTLPDVYEDPVTNLADRIGVTTDEARRIINTMENPYKMMDMLPPNPREEFKDGGISNLKQARDMLEAQALPGESLAYINPEEAMMLKAMGGAGIPINSSGVPSYFGGIGGFVKSAVKGVTGAAKSAVKGVTGAAKSAVGAVKDFAKTDIGQIALAVGTGYALGPAGFGAFSSVSNPYIAGALRGALTSGIVGLASGRGLNAKNILTSAAISGGLSGLTAPKTGSLTKGMELTDAELAAGSRVPTSVAEGSQVLYDDMTFYPQTETTAIPTDTFAGQTIGPVSTEQSVMGLDYGGPEYTTSTLPKTGTDTMKLFSSDAAAAENLSKTGTASTPGFSYGVDEADILTADIGGKTYGAAQFPPVEAPTAPTGIMDIVRDESLTLPQKISEGAKNLVGLGGGDETLKTLIDQPSLSNLMTFAKNNPTLLITSASLLSALSVPQQPDESDFDYEERMSLVNDYADYYGERAGVDMSGADSIDDYETYYTSRIGRALGGDVDVPTGNVRENQAGIMELDYRDTGGRVPIGIKERADDVPAMLSKDEFVFTSKAVKNAGNGDVDKGAEKLYKVMNILENGGTV